MIGEHEAGAMRRAMGLAATYRPHPNPRVGAVVLDAGGRPVGEGAHRGPGSHHAEVVALEQAGEKARGGTLVVTLEPCDHTGRTPPCTGAILQAGVARVVVGATDPDPRVAGKGLRRLTEAGVEVVMWDDPAEVEEVDPGYFHHRRTGRPLVIHKSALTLDGQTAPADLQARWLTSDRAREDAHRLRAEVDAVMVGAGTLIADDPLLDVRLAGFEGQQPRPVVVAGRRPLPPDARLWARNPIVLSPGPLDVPGEVVPVPAEGGWLDLAEGLKALADLGLLTVLVEGGATLAGRLWRQRLIDRGVFYLAGRVAGGLGVGVYAGSFDTLSQASPVTITDVRALGSDLRIDWRT